MSNYKIYVINLEKRPDRKENVKNIFDKIGWSEEGYSFYKAVDGKNLDLNLEIKNLFKGNDFGNRKCVIGCALSHYNIWIELLNDKKNDYYVIFEDDFSLSENFSEIFNFTKKWLESGDVSCMIPGDVSHQSPSENVDMLFLGYHTHNKINNTNSTSYVITNYDNDLYIGGFFSYIITKNGAKKILKYIEENGIKHGIDYLIKINSDLNVCEVKPHIVLSDWVRSVNDVIDSNIQKDFEAFNFKEVNDYNNYLFMKGFDQMNYDLSRFNNKNIDELIEISNSNDNIVGFNTLGYMKTKINMNELILSPYYSDSDGVYIKLDPQLRIKMLYNFGDSQSICNEWNIMSRTPGNMTWNNIKITHEDNNIDYYVIINKPFNNEQVYIPEKTIIFQMEPYCYNDSQNWGVKTWGEWAKPDPSKFLQVRSNEKFMNNCTWGIENIKEPVKISQISTICSSKYYDPGHIKRIDFLKFCENKNEKSLFSIDIYGNDNNHNFKNYKGSLTNANKGSGINPYKYYFMGENNIEYNYITEKLWEPIIGECLCFYYGAPNLSDYINPLAYVALDLNNFEESYNIIKNAIETDLWSQRIDIIRQEKYKIINYYNFFPTVERIITKDLWKDKLKILNETLKIYILKDSDEILRLSSPKSKENLFYTILKEFGFNIEFYEKINVKDIIIQDIEGTTNKKIIWNKNIKYLDITKIPLDSFIAFALPESNHAACDFVSRAQLNILNLYEKIILDGNQIQNYLIIDNNISLKSSLNYLFYHMLYLPQNYDLCKLTNSLLEYGNKIINQHNSLYYNCARETRDLEFNCAQETKLQTPHFISQQGISKILKYWNKNILNNYGESVKDSDLDSGRVNEMEFNFYCVKGNQLFGTPEGILT